MGCSCLLLPASASKCWLIKRSPRHPTSTHSRTASPFSGCRLPAALRRSTPELLRLQRRSQDRVAMPDASMWVQDAGSRTQLAAQAGCLEARHPFVSKERKVGAPIFLKLCLCRRVWFQSSQCAPSQCRCILEARQLAALRCCRIGRSGTGTCRSLRAGPDCEMKRSCAPLLALRGDLLIFG